MVCVCVCARWGVWAWGEVQKFFVSPFFQGVGQCVFPSVEVILEAAGYGSQILRVTVDTLLNGAFYHFQFVRHLFEAFLMVFHEGSAYVLFRFFINLMDGCQGVVFLRSISQTLLSEFHLDVEGRLEVQLGGGFLYRYSFSVLFPFILGIG